MLLSLLLAASGPPATASPTTECAYDLDAMLALDQDAFDQDLEGGWRAVSRRDGCAIAAAELIREWRHEKRSHAAILYWHEGQMRAKGGQIEQAIALFERTYEAPESDTHFGWNHYVSGTIAFLKGDRDGLDAAIARLKQVPEPSGNSFTRPDGTIVQLAWPPNLNVLEGFEKCWGQPYTIAYGPECTKPLGL